MEKLSEKQCVPMHVYSEADHSLETVDTLKNLEILMDVMKKTLDFVGVLARVDADRG